MKKISTFAVMFAAVAILGTALTWSAPDKPPVSSDASAKSAKPCCQAKAAAVTQNSAKTTAAKCCDKDNAKEAVLAKTESTSEEVCQAGKLTTTSAKPAAQKCAFCEEEDCKQQCSSCAEAKKETAAAETDLTATRVAQKGPRRGMGHGPGMGMGHGRGMGMGHGHAGDSQHAKDHKDFFYLIEHRDSIRRTVKNLANGIESLTESDDADVAEMIQVHVEAMYERLENANPIRMQDPIFREVFANAGKIKMEVEHTNKGVRVTETSDDDYTVKLLQEHAKVVSLWIKNGYSELPKNHPAPKR